MKPALAEWGTTRSTSLPIVLARPTMCRTCISATRVCFLIAPTRPQLSPSLRSRCEPLSISSKIERHKRPAQMLRVWMCILLAQSAWAADKVFDLSGHIHPEERAEVTLFGATFPFTASTLSDEHGRFRFQRLSPGAYTVSVLMEDRGEARQTIEVGPSMADARGVVSIEISFKETDFVRSETLSRRHSVSLTQLAVPAKAQ